MIRPTFLAFETAKKALSVSQSGLDTVGHNISNANTIGYTRQRVDQVSISLNGNTSKYQVFGVPTPGMGADVRGISQIRDPYLDNRYRTEATNNGELGVKHDGLTDITNIFDEIMTDGLHFKMGELINAIDIFAQEADSKELAMVVRSTADKLAKMLNKNAAQLEEALVQQKSDLITTVDEKVNSILEQIAALNKSIKQDNFYGNPSNELNDKRNVLIDQLSEYVNIKVVRTPVKVSNDLTIETVSIELNDSGDAAKGTPNVKLVDGSTYNQLKAVEITADNPDIGEYKGNIKIMVVDSSSGLQIDVDSDLSNGVSGDITSKLYKGGLKGYLDIINGAGPAAAPGVSTFRGIPYYQASLDEFAQKLASVFNRINNITAQEAADAAKPGEPNLVTATVDKNLFVPKTLPFTPDPTQPTPKWIDTIQAGTRQFSGGDYEMSFTMDSPDPGKITAKMKDGTTYVGEYTANGKVDFFGTGDDKTAAFSINTTSEAPAATTDLTINAGVTAKNIAVSSSWFDDPLYLTTTKENPSTKAKAELTLTGNSNPAWLRSVALASSDDKVPNGSYVFNYNAGTNEISVVIDSVTYTGTYEKDATIELTSSATGKAGLVISTNSKDIVAGKDSVNTATIKNITGAAADNINKLKVAIKDENGYSVSGYYGSFQGFLVGSLMTDMSTDKSMNTSLLESSTAVISGYADRRDAVSAVSVDEEGINMMTYQNYYNAAARYMTTLDEALDKIINGMGVVGR